MLLRELRDVGEFYLAYRILKVCAMVLAIIAVLVFPTWFLVWVFTGFILLLVAMAPFVVIWAVITFINGLRRM